MRVEMRIKLLPDMRRFGWFCCLLALLLSPFPASAQPAARPGGGEVGLFGTLPIYWGEAADLPELIAGEAPPSWVRQQLEARFRLRLLDVLGPSQGVDTLEGLHNLLLAQPRALSSVENVALDDWVRGGGQLLLFADPMLTAQSEYGLGDRRRPNDVALLSPILAHWGLELQFDDQQSAQEQVVELFEQSFPVALAGRFVRIGGEAADDPPCTLYAGGLAAQCAIGRGHALIFADAALLDIARDGTDCDQRALGALLDRAFGPD